MSFFVIFFAGTCWYTHVYASRQILIKLFKFAIQSQTGVIQKCHTLTREVRNKILLIKLGIVPFGMGKCLIISVKFVKNNELGKMVRDLRRIFPLQWHGVLLLW